MALFLVMLLALPPALFAADAKECPCVPSPPTWSVTACETWNCAAAALVLANGSQGTMVLPTQSSQYKWIVVRRAAPDGGLTPSDPPAFVLESYVSMPLASSRFATIEQGYCPLMLTATDGSILVVSLRSPEHRRAAGK